MASPLAAVYAGVALSCAQAVRRAAGSHSCAEALAIRGSARVNTMLAASLEACGLALRACVVLCLDGRRSAVPVSPDATRVRGLSLCQGAIRDCKGCNFGRAAGAVVRNVRPHTRRRFERGSGARSCLLQWGVGGG